MTPSARTGTVVPVHGANRRVTKGEESELIAAVLAGDAKLYHQLIRPYERCVYMMSLSCMKNEKDAEEVAQETFTSAFWHLAAFPGDSKFSAWLIRIVLDVARNRLGRKAAIGIACDEHECEEMSVSPEVLRDWRELPSGAVEREEIRKLLQRAVRMLPDIYQRVFLLRDVEELTVSDTARILDISTPLVKVRLHRARMMLQRLLAPTFEGNQHCIG